MRKVDVRVSIHLPVEDVFAYVIAVESMPEWRGDVAEAVQLTDGPFGVGTRIRAGGRFLGRPVGIVVEVTELEPGAVFAYRPVSGPLRTHNVYTFESTAGGTQITLTDEIELGGAANGRTRSGRQRSDRRGHDHLALREVPRPANRGRIRGAQGRPPHSEALLESSAS